MTTTTTANRYRKLPVVIEARQLSIENMREIREWIEREGGWGWISLGEQDELFIETLEGSMHAAIGDFVIKGVNGEFYPCKPDVFEKSYEPV